MLRLLQSNALREKEVIPPSPTNPRDELLPLMQAVLGGDDAAKRTLLTTVLPAILRVVRRVLGSNHPDVEDVAQEAAVGLLRSLPTFRRNCTVLHFTCRIAVLTSLAARQRNRYRTALCDSTEPDAIDRLAAGAPEPGQALASSRRRALLRQLLDALSRPQAEALVLHCVLGYTIDEIATMTAVPTDTARSRVRLAKMALRNRVASDPVLAELLRDES